MDTTKIAALILDKLADELTEADAAMLNAWLEADPANRELMLRLTDTAQLSVDLAAYTTYDTTGLRKKIDVLLPQEKLIRRSQRSYKTRGVHNMSFLIRNAAAVILLAATFYYFYSRRNITGAGTQEHAEAVNRMPPGSNKAVLTLSNGRTVALSQTEKELIEDEGQAIRNKAGQLTYNADAHARVVYNTLHTPKGGQFRVTLADGTAVWLNSVSAIRYPTAFKGTDRIVEVDGEAYFEVAPDKMHPFIVKGMYDSVKVTVVGTHFNVNTYKDDGSVMITLLEGRVKVFASGKEKTLMPGQQAQPSGEGIRVLDNVDMEEVMAWKNGDFNFGEKASIETIMKQLARWYDVDVEYQGKVTHYFWGSMSRSTDGLAILKMLEETGGVKFDIKDRKVIVIPSEK